MIKGIEIYSTEPHKQYDSFIKVTYSPELIYSAENPLGLEQNISRSTSLNKILEYKYDFVSLIKDFETETKNHNDIDLVVAWNASHLRYQNTYELRSLLLEGMSNLRKIHGSTHSLYIGHNESFQVILIEDLIA